MNGADLRRFLSYRGGKLVPAEAAGIAAQVAASLAAAHEDGAPHGDLRPENVLVAQRSTPPAVQVTGFGGSGAAGGEFGAAGSGLGPGHDGDYTAPEVAAGGPPTGAGDVWALGVLLVEMITGDARSAAASLPAPLNVVARDCLATDPARRPAAQRVAAYLYQVAATPGGIGKPEPEAPAPAGPAAPGGLSAAASAFAAAAGASPAGVFPAGPATAGSEPAGVFPASQATAGSEPDAASGGPDAAESGTDPAGNGPDAAADGPGVAAGAGGPVFPERPADIVDPWAGWAPAPGFPPVAAAPADGTEPAGRTGRWRRGPLVTLGAAALVATVLAGFTMTASAGERAVPAAQQGSPAQRDSPAPQVSPTPPATTAPEPPASAPPTTRLAVPPSTTAAQERLRVTLAGQVANDGGTLALSIRDGSAIAYVCDGSRIESWLKGTAKAGVLALKGRDGSTLTGTFDARSAEGEVTVATKTNRFELGVVRKPSGLYRTAARVRGAQIDGGWIVLADGRQVGVLSRDGAPAPAPLLDVPTRTTTVDGATVAATTVDADSGEGF